MNSIQATSLALILCILYGTAIGKTMKWSAENDKSFGYVLAVVLTPPVIAFFIGFFV